MSDFVFLCRPDDPTAMMSLGCGSLSGIASSTGKKTALLILTCSGLVSFVAYLWLFSVCYVYPSFFIE